MKILILGGDKRYHQIINSLKDKNDITLVGYHTYFDNCIYKKINEINVKQYDCILFPVNGVKQNYVISAEEEFIIKENFLEDAKKDVYLFSGIMTQPLKEILKDRKCNILMNEQDVVRENAICTVEGIISDLVENTDISINNAHIMIIGYGNIGKYLVSVLKHMGANIVVSIIEEKDKNALEKGNINVCYSNNHINMCSYLKNIDMIINTAPNLVINKALITFINKDAYVLDVASYPHGIDKPALDQKSIKNNIYLGIPSKVAPKTAGLILTKKINQILGGKQ